MRKVGKYEKMRKRALLQTYMISLASLMLCVTMFLGTTMAWFTSEVEAPYNEINIGTMDVDLFLAEGDNNWISLKENKNTMIFSSYSDDSAIPDFFWTPGDIDVKTLKVQNKGNIAFDYQLTIRDDTEPYKVNGSDTVETVEYGEDDILNALRLFEVYVRSEDSGNYTEPVTFEDITVDKGWKRVGDNGETLAEICERRIPIFKSQMSKNDKGEFNDPEDTYSIALHMVESASSEDVMGLKLKLSVKLLAYQKTEQNISFVTNEKELLNAIGEEGISNIVLMSDIELDEDCTVLIPEQKHVMIDLNGYCISQKKAQTAAHSMITNKGTLDIKDSANTGRISYQDTATYDKDNGFASNTIKNEGVLNVYSGTIENTSSDNVMQYGYPHAIDAYQGSVTNIYGGTVKSENYDSIRMFCNSTTEATTVNITGGKIINRVSFQNPGKNTAGYGVLNITGGTFITTAGVKANVRLLNFSTDCSNMKATISGGTFDKGIMVTNNAGSEPVTGIDNWLSVNNLTLTKPAEGSNLWTIS